MADTLEPRHNSGREVVPVLAHAEIVHDLLAGGVFEEEGEGGRGAKRCDARDDGLEERFCRDVGDGSDVDDLDNYRGGGGGDM